MDKEKLWKMILLIPGSLLIYVPVVLLLLEFGTNVHVTTSGLMLTVAFVLFWGGLALYVWSFYDIVTEGEGLPDPRTPPAHLVTDGPYKWVRNPLMLGGFAMLLAESMYFESFYVLVWTLFVIAVSLIVVPNFEEPALALKFGGPYIEYKNDVPRWIPGGKKLREKIQTSNVVDKAADKVDEVKDKIQNH